MTSAITPTLDHAVINVRDRLDEAEVLYRRLGFTLTPRGHHTLGSMNNLAMFGTDYVELIGANAGDDRRQDILGWPDGLNALVFGTEDADATFAALGEAGVPVLPPQAFSRPVSLGHETRDASFRTVRLPHEAVPFGRLYFCHHLTRDLVWRDEWRTHPNGTVGVAGAVIAADAPDAIAALFARMFGAGTVVETQDGYDVLAGLTSIEIQSPETVALRYGPAAPKADGRSSWLAAMRLRTRSLARAAHALRQGDIEGVRADSARVLVPARSTMGVALEFIG